MSVITFLCKDGLIDLKSWNAIPISWRKTEYLSMKLDKKDVSILQILQNDATVPTATIAERCGLSQSPCWRRISLMETAGVIRGRVAIADREQLNLGVLVLVEIKLADNTKSVRPAFKQVASSHPEILQCFVVMGDADYFLLVATRDIRSYDQLMRNVLAKVPGIRQVISRIIIDEVKNTHELPLQFAA
ncbi:MAG: Lrp/AsnC family transcriptional regulator [Steroidobacteraceae bacterium]